MKVEEQFTFITVQMQRKASIPNMCKYDIYLITFYSENMFLEILYH